MQNVLIVREQSAMLVCWAPERLEEAAGRIARKTPNVQDAKLLSWAASARWRSTVLYSRCIGFTPHRKPLGFFSPRDFIFLLGKKKIITIIILKSGHCNEPFVFPPVIFSFMNNG